MKRPQRLLGVLVSLQAGRRKTAEELAGELGVSVRTILRDVDALVAADVPIVAERGRYGGISLLRDAEVDVSRLTGNEAEVLKVIGVDLTLARKLGLEAATRSAARKLATRAPLPPLPGKDALLPLSEVVMIDDTAWFTPGEPADVAAMTGDIRTGHRLSVEYRSSGKRAASTCTVDPYGVLSRGGRWYLIADTDRQPRMFAISRLLSWTVLDEPSRRRPGVTLAGLVGELTVALEGRHEVVVSAVLDVDRVDIARRILGSRLVSVAPAREHDRVLITVGYAELDGVRQLLQFGDHIEVIAPAEARDLLARLAHTIAARHQAG